MILVFNICLMLFFSHPNRNTFPEHRISYHISINGGMISFLHIDESFARILMDFSRSVLLVNNGPNFDNNRYRFPPHPKYSNIPIVFLQVRSHQPEEGPGRVCCRLYTWYFEFVSPMFTNEVYDPFQGFLFDPANCVFYNPNFLHPPAFFGFPPPPMSFVCLDFPWSSCSHHLPRRWPKNIGIDSLRLRPWTGSTIKPNPNDQPP